MTDTTPAVERFYFMNTGMMPSIGGAYVHYADYAALSAQLEAANARAYSLAYAIAGGEDVPGLLDSVNTDELCKILKSQRAWAQDAEFSARAEGKAEGLREAAAACEAHRYGFPNEYLDSCNLRKGHRKHIAAAILALIPAETPAAGGRDD